MKHVHLPDDAISYGGCEEDCYKRGEEKKRYLTCFVQENISLLSFDIKKMYKNVLDL